MPKLPSLLSVFFQIVQENLSFVTTTKFRFLAVRETSTVLLIDMHRSDEANESEKINDHIANELVAKSAEVVKKDTKMTGEHRRGGGEQKRNSGSLAIPTKVSA